MKSNTEIIQKIRDFQNQAQEFNFCPSQEFVDYTVRSSALDVYGVVIYKDNKIYRGIYKKSKEKFIELYNTGILQVFAEEGFVPKFKISDFYTDDYPLILEVEKLDIVHYRNYSYSMIKEEGKLKLRLLEILSEFGYTLIDGHSGNTTFKDNNPVFFDFGSFIKSERTGWADYEIWQYNIFPLICLSLGKFMTARGVYYSVPDPWLVPYVALKDSKEAKNTIEEFLRIFNCDETIQEKLHNFKALTSSEVDVLFAAKNFAIGINQRDKYLDFATRTEKNEIVYDVVLNDIRNKVSNTSIIHLGCSTGGFVNKCVKSGNFSKIYGIDNNEFIIDYAFNNVENCQFIFCNPIIHSPVIPIKANVVYASGIVCDCLLNKPRVDIIHLLDKIWSYTSNLLYIEFFPYGKNKEKCSKNSVPDYYNIDWFEKHLDKNYLILSKKVLDTVQIDGVDEPFRILYETKIKD